MGIAYRMACHFLLRLVHCKWVQNHWVWNLFWDFLEEKLDQVQFRTCRLTSLEEARWWNCLECPDKDSYWPLKNRDCNDFWPKEISITSKSHVRISSSIRKSYPNSSKQCFRLLGFKFFFHEKNVSRTRSFILEITCFSKSTLYLLYFSFSIRLSESNDKVFPSSHLL